MSNLAYHNMLPMVCGNPQVQMPPMGYPQQFGGQVPVLPISQNGMPVVGGPSAMMNVGGPVPVFGGLGQSQVGLGNPYTYMLDQWGNLVAIPPQYIQQTPRYMFGS